MSTGSAASPTIDHLAQTWRSLDALCADLTEAQWATPTGCPGWTVQDCVAHLIDYEERALGRPAPEHVPADLTHTKNAMGEANEVGVDARRARSSAEVLDELREVTAARRRQLEALTEADLAREVVTPAGPGPLTAMLTLRLMDTWSHEQDIRRALALPGHETGPAAEEATAYFTRFLPMVIGKRAGAADGTSVVVELGDQPAIAIAVAGGRATVVDAIERSPTVRLALPVATFAALVGGRDDVPDDVVVEGDAALAGRILDGLAFLP